MKKMDSNKKYRTIRYMKKRDLKLTEENSDSKLREKLNNMPEDTNMVVRLRVNSPVFVEEALEAKQENIMEITKVNS